MSRSHDQTALFLKMLWSVPAFLLLLIVSCRPSQAASVSIPEEIEALQSLYERDARGREERLRLEEELAKASSEIATRKAWRAEQNRFLDQREQLVADRERLAARLADLERREKAVETLSEELASRGTAIEARETELESQGESARRDQQDLDRKLEAKADQQPEPQWVETTLPLGTVIEVELTQTVSSRTAQRGDRFSSRVARDVYSADGVLVVPSGSEMRGTVTSAKRLRRIGGQAQLGIEMDRLVLPSGVSLTVHASLFEVGTNQRKDKRKILGAAAAGALLGRILGSRGGGSTAIGAALGAAAGTAVVASRRGQDIELMAGDIIAVRLDERVTVETEMVGVAGP